MLFRSRACQLIEELDAGDVVGGMIDIYPEPVKEKTIKFDPDRINAYLGTDISKEEQLSYFPALEIRYNSETEELTIPTFRQDLLRGADIAEEVARFYGYDKIPSTLPATKDVSGRLSYKFEVEDRIRSFMQSYGYSEAMTYSFESPRVFDKCLMDENDPLRKAIVISNPLGEDYSIMRTSLLNGMFTSLSTNYNRRNKEARLFEMSNIYIAEDLPLTKLPDERMTLAFGFYGEGDFFTLKGALEELMDNLGLSGKRHYENTGKLNFLHPGRQAVLTYDSMQIAFLGEVHPQVVKNYGLAARTYIAQVDVAALYDLVSSDRKYTGIPKYPAISRDLSLVMSRDIPAGDIEDVIACHNIALLIYAKAAVSISVICKTDIQAIVYNVLLQMFDMCASTVRIDVVAIRLCIHHIGFCAKCVKYAFCDRPCSAVCAVKSDPDVFEAVFRQGDQITDVTVAAGHIVYRTADLFPFSQRHIDLAVNIVFNL